jgi:hypothetical protein
VSTYCQSANSTGLNKKCIISILIIGDKQTKTELELSVIDLSSSIPLFDGITLPFSQKYLKK